MQTRIRPTLPKLSVLSCLCLPARTELSSIGVALIQLLQHLLTLSVGEWVGEGEEGGCSTHIQQPVSERQNELVVYNLQRSKGENKNDRQSDIPVPLCMLVSSSLKK